MYSHLRGKWRLKYHALQPGMANAFLQIINVVLQIFHNGCMNIEFDIRRHLTIIVNCSPPQVDIRIWSKERRYYCIYIIIICVDISYNTNLDIVSLSQCYCSPFVFCTSSYVHVINKNTHSFPFFCCCNFQILARITKTLINRRLCYNFKYLLHHILVR